MLRDLVRKLSYASGALALYHRARNARTLTVVMFHRVLEESDPRWPGADPGYTLPVDVFRACLGFFVRHYQVVSLEQVLRARAGTGRLPSRALLLTFDDGWADNVDHALPALRDAGLPAVMFVVSGAVGRSQPFFQEQLVSAWQRGVLQVGELDAALARRDLGQGTDGNGIAELRRLIAALETLDKATRDDVLAPFVPVLDDGLVHMVDVAGLERLDRHGVVLGLHGMTHAPMTRVADLDRELAGARGQLAAITGGAPALSMSFPHGAHDPAIAAKAHEAGYELVFTSVPVLNPTAEGPGGRLGRVGFETGAVVDAKGRFRPDRLAARLFRRPVAALDDSVYPARAHSSSSALVRWMSRSRGSWLGGLLQ